MPTIVSGLNKCKWPIVKQIIFNEFDNTVIEILIHHKEGSKIITNNWKTFEHMNLLHITNIFNENKPITDIVPIHKVNDADK